MVTATLEPLTSPAPQLTPVELQVLQYADLIDRYVRRRVHEPAQVDRVLREVFRKAGADPAQVQAHPLRWLIGTARRECAQVHSPYLFRS